MTDATGAERASAYIRLEHFTEDAAPLVAHLGFDLPLAHVNRSERPQGYRQAFTPELKDIVAGCCAEDIARFGYEF